MVFSLSTVQAAEDKVGFKASGKVKTIEGKIKKDELHEVIIVSDGTDIKKKRSEVVGVKYGMVPEQFYQVKGLLEAGDLQNAEEFLMYALGKAKRNKDYKTPKGKLFMQHWLYSRAQLAMRQGNYPMAQKAFSQIVGAVPNSVWYFQARLGEADALVKLKKTDAALERYSLSVRDFKEVASKYKLSKSKVGGYVLQAELGKLSMSVDKLLATKEPDQNLLSKRYSEFKALGSKYKPNKAAAKAGMLLKAKILAGQKKFKEVLPLLDKQIIEAQLSDRMDQLFDLYLQRADAAFQSEQFRAAQIDYLRLWLEFEVDGEIGGLTHLRLGKCIRELKDKEWELRTRRHFAWAKSTKAEPYATLAGEELNTMKKPEAASEKKKD
jgi:tetratricopeptide (TPR) repeat protein